MTLGRPEYPSLSKFDLAEKAVTRLAKSKRRFSAYPKGDQGPGLFASSVIGKIGTYDHSNSSQINSWMQSWRIPGAEKKANDVESSLAVFVGISASDDMPHLDGLHPGPPFVTITTKFVDACLRISEIFPHFARLIASNPSLEKVTESRFVLFDHLDPKRDPDASITKALEEERDEIFSIRSTAAAVRWAIAHEMAHALGSKSERQSAYQYALELFPGMEEEQWSKKRKKLSDYPRAFERYRDEIACDMLAVAYILESDFSKDDLMTQVSGSLLALEALIWDGWFQDSSDLSETHPSPTLRFMLVMRAWMERLSDAETWQDRRPPGTFGVEDVAHWGAFERWAAGEFSQDRGGMSWGSHLSAVRSRLQGAIPLITPDQIYFSGPSGIFQAPMCNKMQAESSAIRFEPAPQRDSYT